MTMDTAPRATRRQLVPFAALSAGYFAHIGFFNPYLPLWLKHLGLSLWMIGLLTSMQAVTRVFAPYIWGWLSDRNGARVPLMRWCSGMALLCSFGLLFDPSPWWLAAVLFGMFIHTSAMMPMSEAAMAHLVSHMGTLDVRRYGRIRLWESVGFLVTVFVSGAWFEAWGMSGFPYWAVMTLLAVNISTWYLPDKRESVAHVHGQAGFWQVLRQAQSRWFFATLFFHVLSHVSIYTFFSLYLDELGYGKDMIGVLWAVSVIVEIVGFFSQSKWLHLLSLPLWLCVYGFDGVAHGHDGVLCTCIAGAAGGAMPACIHFCYSTYRQHCLVVTTFPRALARQGTGFVRGDRLRSHWRHRGTGRRGFKHAFWLATGVCHCHAGGFSSLALRPQATHCFRAGCSFF